MLLCRKLGELFAALLVTEARGQSTESPNRFESINDCKPMALEVGSVVSGVLDLGIPEANVQAAVASRLHSALLHAPAHRRVPAGVRSR